MHQITANLWETETLSPFPGLNTHAYLWTTPEGNVLFYNTTLTTEFDAIAGLGGVAHHYLSHRDEIAPSLADVRERFDARLHIHKADAGEVTVVPVDDPFDTRHVALAGLEVIPTPGHTPGSACYLATIDGKQHLFTGDTLVLGENGVWWAGYLEGHSDRAALLATLDLLAELTPDVVVSSAFMGEKGVVVLDRPWAECVAEAKRTLLGAQA